MQQMHKEIGERIVKTFSKIYPDNFDEPQPKQTELKFCGVDDTAEMMRVRDVLDKAGLKVTDSRILADIVKAVKQSEN